MEKIKTCLILIALLTSLSGKGIVPTGGDKAKKGIAVWMTSPATNVMFQLQKENLVLGKQANEGETITIDAKKTFQTIDGFGNCLTGGSATLLHKMDAASRAAILKELFATDGNNN